MTDYKQLCAELLLFAEEAGEICTCEGLWPVKCDPNYALLDRARAALAEPEPEGPSAEEVEELCEEHCFMVEGYESIECLQGLINEAIARWGRPAPVTAEGELVELVTILRGTARCLESHSYPHTAAFITRAADLLEQCRAAPNHTRELLIKLSSHMAYMQGQLEARHELDDLEDYYWYRESVALRQKVIDALANGREPASVVGEPSDRELLDILADSISEACECSSIAIDEYESETGCSIEAFGSELIAFARAVLARFGGQQ